MKTALITTLASLALCVPVAAADSPSDRPRFTTDKSDVISRMLDNAPPDVVDRYLARQQASAPVPTDAFDRSPLADRTGRLGTAVTTTAVDDRGLDGFRLAVALLVAAAVGAASVAAVPAGRRTLAHH